MSTTWFTTTRTPVGELLLVGDGDALREIRLPNRDHRPEPGWKPDARPFRAALRQLDAYFHGELREFDLDLSPVGTEFQKKVWRTLRRIPYGKTISYGDLARRIGQPNASRAVGAANGRNRLPIVIPCHRVIAHDGTLGGYGGGLSVKKRLLVLEGAL